jgi:hypothetical protein
MNGQKRVEEVDVSKKTIIVLVILTIIVSLVSTVTVISQINGITIATPTPQTQDEAQVRFTILEPQGPAEPAFDTATANVVLNIEKPT